MQVIRNYKFAIYPKGGKLTLLQNTLGTCRFVYNSLLAKRIKAYEDSKETIGNYACNAIIPTLDLKTSVHSQVLQSVSARLDNAFKAFFRRIKAGGEKPGFPRFKSCRRYNSFTFPQRGFKLTDKKLKLSKIGEIKINLHRKIEGKIKTLTIKREGTKWFAIFSAEVDIIPKVKVETKAVGIDLGCIDFAVCSDGVKVENPHFFKKSQEKLAKAQVKFSKISQNTPHDDPKKIKILKNIRSIHRKIADQRKDFLHKLSRKFVSDYSHICVENIKPSQLLDDNWRSLNKSILDSGWSNFLNMLSYKAEEAGATILKVNPAYTSQDCSKCGTRIPKDLKDRTHKCICGLEIDRDLNSSYNILRLGMESLAKA